MKKKMSTNKKPRGRPNVPGMMEWMEWIFLLGSGALTLITLVGYVVTKAGVWQAEGIDPVTGVITQLTENFDWMLGLFLISMALMFTLSGALRTISLAIRERGVHPIAPAGTILFGIVSAVLIFIFLDPIKTQIDITAVDLWQLNTLSAAQRNALLWGVGFAITLPIFAGVFSTSMFTVFLSYGIGRTVETAMETAAGVEITETYSFWARLFPFLRRGGTTTTSKHGRKRHRAKVLAKKR